MDKCYVCDGRHDVAADTVLLSVPLCSYCRGFFDAAMCDIEEAEVAALESTLDIADFLR